MTKKEIVLKVAAETNLKQLDVKKAVQKSLEAIVASLAKGETVELRNFGIFKVKQRKGRTGRNPRTGEKVPVPPKRVVVFKPGLVMKREIR
ncbi:MAG: integration host factor subunit beta [Candidatus Omnitrophica bacterium]|nr:integration host factor subunit beta [Candidatus Omnitrophota bacterium]